MNTALVIGTLLAIALLLIAGLFSGRKVTDAKSFDTGGGKAGTWLVCGAIMGTLVGGQTTIGTAQLAFAYGISAWWFALGSTFGCILLALVYAGPLRRSGCTTLLEIVGREYGHKAELVGSILSMISIFISILAQILSASALITSFFPVSFLAGALITVFLMVCYVLFGGAIGAGIGGLVKLVLLYVSCLVAGVAVWGLAHGHTGLMSTLHDMLDGTALGQINQLGTSAEVSHRYGNLVARGPLKDIGSALSLTLGVLSTQTYAQGIWMAKSTRTARKGAMLSALLIPPIGIASILIGLYMRGHYVTASEWEAMQAMGQILPEGVGVIGSSAQAFPMFVMNEMPNLLGGIILGTLLVTVIGSGSGLSLGASTILVRDVISNIRAYIRRRRHLEVAPPYSSLWLSRGAILGILLLGVIIALTLSGGFINDLGFLSLGLRATSVLISLSCALWLHGRFSVRFALGSMIAASVTMLLAKMIALPGDAMFWGLAVGLVVMFAGKRKTI